MNSTIDNTMVRSRQGSLVDRDILDNPISIIGCGAIGSFVALTLAKMGFHSLIVYDDDFVSTENISNQFYRYKDIGNNKASALCHMLEDFENILITPIPQRYEGGTPLAPYVIMAVDSMLSRKIIYKSIRAQPVFGFVDGRMGGQQAEIYTIKNNRSECSIYNNYLWSEEETEELPCTEKAVMYNVLWIASGIANSLRLMMEEKPYKNVTLMDFENVEQRNIDHRQEA